MKVYRDIESLTKKQRKKYAKKLLPLVRNWCLDQGVTEDKIIYNLECTYRGVQLLEEANAKFASVMQRRRDLTEAEDMHSLRKSMLSARPNPTSIKEYMSRKHGMVTKQEEGSDGSLGEMFENLVKHLPR